MGKGSRQNRSVTLGKGLALVDGHVGLWKEISYRLAELRPASLVLRDRAGWLRNPCWLLVGVHGTEGVRGTCFLVILLAVLALRSCAGTEDPSFLHAVNIRTRTATDKGNPTV